MFTQYICFDDFLNYGWTGLKDKGDNGLIQQYCCRVNLRQGNSGQAEHPITQDPNNNRATHSQQLVQFPSHDNK